MAGKKKSSSDIPTDRSSNPRTQAQQSGKKAGVEREGPHGERLDEALIDAEVSSKTMEGGHSVPQEDVTETFQKQDQDSSER